MDATELLRSAEELHRTGHLQEAAAVYNQLGVALCQSGDFVLAAAHFQQAIEFRDAFFEAYNNLGNALRGQNRLEEAMTAYEQALQLKPDYADAHFNRANALCAQGKLEAAISVYRRALQIQASHLDAANNLGNVLVQAGQSAQAVAVFEELIQRAPTLAKARNNFGAALLNLGRVQEAIDQFRQAIALDPAYASARQNLAYVMRQTPNQPLETRSNPAREFFDVGVALGKAGDLTGAATNLRKAVQLNPNYAEAYFNLGVACGDLHLFDEAVAAYKHAIRLRENYAEARHGLAMVRLQLGQFEQGWPDYEFRWKLPSAPKPYAHRAPAWRGESLEGKTILLYTEQGLGDTLQFIRYLPIVAGRAKRTYLVCPPALEKLFSQWTNVDLLTDGAQRIPQYDVHCAVTSFPLAFGTHLDSIPSDVPYLMPDPALLEKWKRRLSDTSQLKVGLVWAGNPLHQNDRQRSIALGRLKPLSQFADRVIFYGLQKGAAANQRNDVPELNLVDLSDDLTDFVDTAAAIACMDVVISVDTSVAHLAGALGARVWTLLAFASDWRWLVDRTDSPWYPTMRLFRQRTTGDWQAPVAQLVDALGDLLSQRRDASNAASRCT